MLGLRWNSKCVGWGVVFSVAATTGVSCGGDSVATTPGGTSEPVASPCGALDADAVPRIASANVERVLRRGSRALDFTNAMFVPQKLLNGRAPNGLWDHQGLDDGIDDLVKSVKEDLFSSGEVESVVGGVVTYRLSADCSNSSSAAPASAATDGGVTVTTPSPTDTTCENFYRDHEPRLVVSRVGCSAGDNLHLDVVIDADHKTVVSSDWYEDRLAASLDFARLASVIEANGSLGKGVVLDRTAGKMSASLEAKASAPVTFRVSIPEAIDVQWHSDKLRGGVSFARADNVLTVTADPAAQRVIGSFAVGALDYTLPLRNFASVLDRSSDAPDTDVVTVSIAGLDGSFDYDAKTDALSMLGLGLGGSTSRVTRNGSTLLTIDANPDKNRHVDVRFSADAQKKLLVDIAPSFQLNLEYKMADINPLVKDLEQFALDDTLTIQVEGAQGLKLLESMAGKVFLLNGGVGDYLAMSTGHLNMTSRSMSGDNVGVAPGKCLHRGSGPFSGQHEFLRQFSAVDCP